MGQNFRRTKIVATVGPSTWSEVDGEKRIEEIMVAGADVFRLNFSHGKYEEKQAQVRDIRAVAKRLNRHVTIIQDLQGPKIRLGDVKDDSLFVKTGDELILDYALKDAEHDGSFTIPLQYNLAEKVKVGETVYIFDGKIKTEIIKIPTKTSIKVKVLNGGEIKRKKGINLPDTDFGKYAFSDKDLADMEFGHDKNFDFVALSFVQSAEDIRLARKVLKEKGYPDNIKIVAKIETRQATKNDKVMEEIATEADAIIVARGDMGYEVGMEQIPTIQRRLVHICRQHGIPVIIATQTMISMYDSPVPSRSDADNIAAAVIMGVDAIMLSEETAVGEFPVETVTELSKIIMYTQDNNNVLAAPAPMDNMQMDMICKAAVQLAEDLNVDNVVTETQTSWTTRIVSANRPARRILSVTDNPSIANQMTMFYGVDSYVRPYEHNYGLKLAEELRRAGKVAPNKSKATVVIVSGRFDDSDCKFSDTIQLRAIK